MYETENVSYLIDPTDSVQAYEEAGKLVRSESAYERGMKALASLDHVQQVNAIEGNFMIIQFTLPKIFVYSALLFINWLYFLEYNNMKDNLKQYLKKFVENKKVVREEDIKEFFSEMASNKRPKVSDVPTFCRW